MSYLRYMSLFTYCGVQHISVSPGVCRRIHVFVYVICVCLRIVFVYVICLCLRIVVSNTYLYLQVFVGGFMFYLHYMSLFTYCGVQHICISRCL